MYDNHFDEITIEAGNCLFCRLDDYPDPQLVIAGSRIYVTLLDGKVSLTELVNAYTEKRKERGE